MIKKTLFIIKEMFEGIKSNQVVFFSSLFTISFSFFILFAFFLGVMNMIHQLNILTEEIEIVVFLDDNANVNDVYRSINKIDNVIDAKFTSKDDAMDKFSEDMTNFDQYEDILKDFPLPESFSIFLKNQNEQTVTEVIAKLESIDGINEIIFQKDSLNMIKKLKRVFTIAIIVLTLFLSMISIFIIGSSIRLTIFSRRENIDIMKLVGAYRIFIKLPFIVEGGFQGFLSSLLGLGMVYGVYSVLVRENIPLFFFSQDTIIYFLIGGTILGIAGSVFSITKFVKY